MQRIVYGIGVGVALVAPPTPQAAVSSEYRQLEAHVHGQAEIGFAVDGDRLVSEFRTPMYSLVGFEYAPQTDTQWQDYNGAVRILGDAVSLFEFGETECSVEKASINEPEFQEANHPHVHGDEHHHDEHADHHDSEARHLDFSVQYEFACENLNQLESIEVGFFEKFKGIEKIEAVFVGESTHVAELTRSRAIFDVVRK